MEELIRASQWRLGFVARMLWKQWGACHLFPMPPIRRSTANDDVACVPTRLAGLICLLLGFSGGSPSQLEREVCVYLQLEEPCSHRAERLRATL